MYLTRRSNPADCHPDGVTRITVHGFLNVLANTQNIADGAIGIFNPHVHDAAAVGNTVEGGSTFTRPWPNSLRMSNGTRTNAPPLSGTGSITASN